MGTRRFGRWWDDIVERGLDVPVIEGQAGDSRGVLQRWYEDILALGRFAGWSVEFKPGGTHQGSGVWFIHEEVGAELWALIPQAWCPPATWRV